MTYSNAQILSAVINKWASPLVQSLLLESVSNIPMIGSIENNMRSTGWVSNRWSIMNELSPLLTNATGLIVEPLLNKYISTIPDDTIPQVAHGIVDAGLNSGESVSLFEGKITLEQKDLRELKRLLELNLPLPYASCYEVKTTKTKKTND